MLLLFLAMSMKQAWVGKDIKVLSIVIPRLRHLPLALPEDVQAIPGSGVSIYLCLHLSVLPYRSGPRICPQTTPRVIRTLKSRWTSVLGMHHIFRWDHFILQSLSREFFHVLSSVAIFIFTIHRCPWGMLKAQTVNAVCQRRVFL